MKKYKYAAIICIVILLLFVIRSQVFQQDDFYQILRVYQIALADGNILLVALMFLLMPMNWVLESMKWRILIGHVEKTTLVKAFRTIWAGVSLGLITPYRIGEFGARAMFVDSNTRPFAVCCTLVNSIAQNMANVGFGLIGLYLLMPRQDLFYDFNLILIMSVATLILMVLGYLYLPKLSIVLTRFKFIPSQISESIRAIREFKLPILLINALLSIARYLVYFLQYALLFMFFEQDILFVHLFIGISVQFLIQSIVPIPPAIGVLANIEIALLVWSYFDMNPLVIVSVTMGIWVINLLIPSIFGLLFIKKRILQLTD